MKIKQQELEALIFREQQSSVGALNSALGGARSELMERYFAEPYGDEVEGRSKIVDTTVRDVIESLKPELMDIFVGGDKVVEFAPLGAEDVDAAAQETETCQHIFMEQNDGFMILYNWFTDALLQKNGYVKRYWDERKRVEVEEYDDLTPEEAAQLLAELEATSDEVEFLGRDGGLDEETGEITPLYVKIRRTSTEKRYTIENVAPEEIFVSPQWNKVKFDGIPFVGHRPRITVSDLIEMGFDRKQVEALQDYDVELETEEAATRFSQDDLDQLNQRDRDGAMREIEIWENYIRADIDKDGIAELLQVYTEGKNGKILKRNGKPAIEEVATVPFDVLTPLPIPHRHYGLSIAEIVQDLAKIKTVLTRQLLDNIVAANNPDEVVDTDQMDEDTFDDLSQVGIKRTIRIRGGMASYGVVQPANTAVQSLQGIEYIDSLREERTGITRFNQGLDPNSLNHTASGIQQLMSAAQKKMLMIARIFAETGVRDLFVNMHRDLRAGPIRELMVKLREEYVPVNPRMWRERTDMVVNVGLGTGDRDVQFARLSMVLEQQKEMIAQGMPIYDKLYTTLERMLEMSGFKDVANFFPSPEEVQAMMEARAQEPPQPDPAMMIAQAEIEKDREKNMGDQAVAEGKLQIDAAKQQLEREKFEFEKLMSAQTDGGAMNKLEVDVALTREKLAADLVELERKLEWEREKFDREHRMKLAEMGLSELPESVVDPRTEGLKEVLENTLASMKAISQEMAKANGPRSVRVVKDENGDVIGTETTPLN